MERNSHSELSFNNKCLAEWKDQKRLTAISITQICQKWMSAPLVEILMLKENSLDFHQTYDRPKQNNLQVLHNSFVLSTYLKKGNNLNFKKGLKLSPPIKLTLMGYVYQKDNKSKHYVIY